MNSGTEAMPIARQQYCQDAPNDNPQHSQFLRDEKAKSNVAKNKETLILFNQYSPDQQWEIWEGIEKNLDVQKYANPKFTAWQMWKIRDALEEGFDVTALCDPSHDDYMTTVLHRSLTEGFDFQPYLEQGYDAAQINEIRAGARSNVNYLIYAKTYFNEDQMHTIRTGLEKEQDISRILDPRYSADSMRLILIAQMEKKIAMESINPNMSYTDIIHHINSHER